MTAGNVHIYLDRCGKIIKTLGRGEFFGEISFFSNRERTAAARSLNFSSVFELKREDFLAVVQDFPTDKVNWRMFVQNLICLILIGNFL